MPNKFRTGLISEYNANKKQQSEQSKIKKKHNINDKNVVIVEKSNTIKFLIKALILLIKTLAWILLITLASIGVLCLLYPDTRQEFMKVITEIFNEIF